MDKSPSPFMGPNTGASEIYLGQTLPPRPAIGEPNDWRYINDGWRQTLEGVAHIPPTRHEEQITKILNDPIFTKLWLYDPAGRPSVDYTTTTADGQNTYARFEKGAAHRESALPENKIDLVTYEDFRDGIATAGLGLAILGEYIANAASRDISQTLLRIATRGNIDLRALQDPYVEQYVTDAILLFGRSKYNDQNPGNNTTFGSPYKKTTEGGTRNKTSDDTIKEWLHEERTHRPTERVDGRSLILRVMNDFIKGSRNDSAWTAANPKLVEYEANLARADRHSFAGRISMSAQSELTRIRQQDILITNPWADQMQ